MTRVLYQVMATLVIVVTKGYNSSSHNDNPPGIAYAGKISQHLY